MFVHIVPMSLVSHVFIVPRFDVSHFVWFSVVVFMVVGMCSYGEVRVDSDRSFSLTWSFRCSVFCTSVCLWSFLMERQLSRAAHPPCKTQKKNCQRRGVRRPVKRCRERQWSHLSAYEEQARRENVQPVGQPQTDADADAQNVACTKG